MKIFLIGLSAVVVLALLTVLLRTPRADRNWLPALAQTPRFTPADARWTLDALRAYEFGEDGATVKEWRGADIDPNDLSEIWYFVEPFESWDAFAHSFVSFVFKGDEPRHVVVSVEARREEGETYSALRGVFNEYELLYQWSTEKDILTRIAIDLDHDLYAYRVDASPEQAQAILQHFIARTNRLAERPRFYNTLASNCTNELAKAVNEAFPGALPWRRAYVFTGRSGEYLYKRGFITGEGRFKDIQARANISPLVRDLRALPTGDFSRAWREKFSSGRDQTTSPDGSAN
ncbi:MAG: DUF4105 domain-containing protein [Pseudomonadota bacterium]